MKYLILTALLLFQIQSYAQSSEERFESAYFPKKDGAEIVYSSAMHSLTLDVISNKIQPLDQPGYILVGNKTLQFVFIPDKALQTDDTTTAMKKKLLLSYVKYETDYAKNDLKLNYTNLKEEWVTINNKLFLLWYYDMPAKYKSVLKQVNLSAICFASALNLNTPLTILDKFDDNKELLIKVAKTLKENNFKIDFDEWVQN